MRQYRGKTKDGKWVKGWPIPIGDRIVMILDEWIGDTSEFDPFENMLNEYTEVITSLAEVLPETVGQETGAKDRNNQPIWEKDEVMIFGDYTDAQRGIVIYDEEEATFRLDVGTEEYCPFFPREVKVIENKDLLNAVPPETN